MLNPTQQVPVYTLEPDEIAGNKNFRLYQFEGDLPNQADLLIPHRKNHYLFVFVRQADSRQWIDMTPHTLKDNTFYFTGPNQIIVKEEIKQLWSTGIAFTPEFLSLQGNTMLSKLPVIQNPHSQYELELSDTDVLFIEDMLDKINQEYGKPGEWQQALLGAYLAALLTYLSRLYTEHFSRKNAPVPDNQLLKSFQAKVNDSFRELHEVSDYASILNISAGHLSEMVKDQSGKPAIKHIHDRLVMEARRSLFHTSNSLKEIAFELGFSDASYFSRFFKRECGITPAEYRMSIRKMYQ